MFCLGPKLLFSHFCLCNQSFVCTHCSLDILNDLVFEFANLFTDLSLIRLSACSRLELLFKLCHHSAQLFLGFINSRT